MPRFSEIEREHIRPIEVIDVPVACWAIDKDWAKRPTTPIPMGFRPVSADRNDWCKRRAALYATRQLIDSMRERDIVPTQLNDLWIETYNNAFMRFRVLMGSCHPQDVRQPHPIWEGRGEDTVHKFLVEEGVAELYDALTRVEVACSPARVEATDDEIEELVAMAPEALRGLPEAKAQRLRRLLHFVYEELAGL